MELGLGDGERIGLWEAGEQLWWRGLGGPSTLELAQELVGVEAGWSRSAVRSQCRRRLAAAHPDLGGDGQLFLRIGVACRLLLPSYKHAEL